MKRVSIAILAILVALLLGACSEPFDIAKLGGKVLTYYAPIDGEFNGHDYGTFTFNEAGDGGNFEMLEFDFDYPTEAAETAGLLSGKTWFQRGGYRGTFTYNKDTGAAVMSISDRYYLKEAAVTAYQADYEWRTLLSIAQEEVFDGMTVATRTQSGTVVINQDNIAQVFIADGDNYTMNMVMTESLSDGTHTETQVIEMSQTLAIGATALTLTTVQDMTGTSETTGSDPVVTQIVQTSTETCRVDNVFEIGGTGTDFEKIWKEGNGVSFNITMTERSIVVDDTSDAAPTAPTVDPATGVGLNDPAGDDAYMIDRNQSSGSIALHRGKNYVIPTSSLTYASRNLK